MPTALNCRGLAGLDYLRRATDLLLRIRREDLHAGLWEAADLHWWWRDEGWDDPEGQVFWFDEEGAPVAGLLLYDDGVELDCDCFWLPSARERVAVEIWPDIIARMTGRSRAAGKPARLMVRDDDMGWAECLRRHGFEAADPVLVHMEQTLTDPPPAAPLPTGFEILDAGSWDGRSAHHLERRNGPDVMTRLRQCSLYAPDLDLAIRQGDDVAAYCLAWLDPVNWIGLFEPVRTEDAFQGRGLGTVLLTEGLRRLVARGAAIVRVSHNATNEAAERLYRRVGFRPTFRRVTYRFAADGPAPPAPR